MMTTLRKAINDGKLDEFIAEREAEAQPHGDGEDFHRTIISMVQKSKAVPEASPKDCPDD